MINVKIVEKKHESLHIAKKINEHQIVFIVDYIKPRVIKIGYALRKKGYKVVLLLNEKQKKDNRDDYHWASGGGISGAGDVQASRHPSGMRIPALRALCRLHRGLLRF